MTRARPALGLAVAAAVFLLDQLVKFAVTGPLGLSMVGDVREILPVFALRFVDNRGVSLGLLHADSEVMRWALVLLTGVIAAGVCVWMFRERARIDQAALGAVLG